MMIDTTAGIHVDRNLLDNYIASLVNRFFKILPMRENEEFSLSEYMRSLQSEMLGCKELISLLQFDPRYLSLLSILQCLIDHPEYDVRTVRREVFHAISLCNKLKNSCSKEVVAT